MEQKQTLAQLPRGSYVITDACICCGRCALLCPAACIEVDFPYRIRQEDCQKCGNCLEVCQARAVRVHV